MLCTYIYSPTFKVSHGTGVLDTISNMYRIFSIISHGQGSHMVGKTGKTGKKIMVMEKSGNFILGQKSGNFLFSAKSPGIFFQNGSMPRFL